MSNSLLKEEWRKVVADEIDESQNFEISSRGRVKSFNRSNNSLEGNILSGSFLSGYKTVSIKLKNRKRKIYYLHKLIAEIFSIEHKADQIFIIHLDYNKTNNNLENLKWATREELNIHQKLNPDFEKKKFDNAKLTQKIADKIRRNIIKDAVNNKLNYSNIARKYNVSVTQLKRIERGENWK